MALFSFSQTIYLEGKDTLVSITIDQVRKANEVFLERDNLNDENALLYQKLEGKEATISTLSEKTDEQDGIIERLEKQVLNGEQILALREESITKYKQQLKKQKRIGWLWKVGAVVGIGLAVL